MVTNLSLLTAVSIVLAWVFAVVPISGHTVLRLSFVKSRYVAGVLAGPSQVRGGGAADLIGYFINPGPFFQDSP